MKIILRFFFVIVTFCLVLKTEAQQPFSKHLTVANGLPSNAVYAVLEDHLGYIWFTCDEGLYRFDGENYKSYKAPNQNTFSGSALTEDPLGRVWYQNFDGDSYFVENEKLKLFPKKNKVNFFPNRFMKNYVFDKSENELDVYDVRSLKIVKSFPLESSKTFSSVIFQGEFYYIEAQNLFKITSNLKRKKVCSLPIALFDFPLLMANNDHLFFTKKQSADNGIWEIKHGKAEKIISFQKEMTIQGIKCNDVHLFLQTTQGTHQYTLNGGFIATYFSDYNFSDVLIDRKKNYWFTSPNDGILLVPELNVVQMDLPSLSPYRILNIDDELIVSTKNEQLLSYNLKNKSIKNIYQGTNNVEIYYLHQDKINDRLFCAMSDGFTYFSSKAQPNSFQKIVMAIKQIAPIDEKYNAFVASGTFGFFVHKSNISKVSRFDRWISKLPQRKHKDFYFYECMNNVRGKSLEMDASHESVYFTTNIGLFVYSKGVLSEIKSNNKSVILTRLFFWQNSVYGFGASGKVIKVKNQTIVPATDIHPELLQTNIKQVVSHGNHLIVRTLSNLFVIQKKSSTNERLFQFDLTNLECNDVAMVNNSVWIVTSNGLIEWKLNHAFKRGIRGIFRIDQFTVNNHEVFTKPNLIFSHAQNNIAIHFSLLDFGTKTIDNLWYRINNQKWKKLDHTIRDLNFSSLSPNDYSIQFRGKVNGKMQALESVNFTIREPFWNRTWFFVLVAIAIFGLSALYFSRQLKIVSTRNQLINEKITLESDLNKSLLSSIKSQMNPHFIFNALNTIQGYIFLNDKENASGFLSKFSQLTRAILEMSEKDEVLLSEELSTLKLYLELEKMRFQDGFEFQISTQHLNPDSIKIPSMLIQPYVENAIKHGLLHSASNKFLHISILKEASVLIVEIDDNGIGRKKSEELRNQKEKYHNSFSSNANEKRLQILSKDKPIVVEYNDKIDANGQSLGTTVLLKIHLNV